MVLGEMEGGSNHELGDNYSYYVTLIVYIAPRDYIMLPVTFEIFPVDGSCVFKGITYLTSSR
jgi:hypothetical protein